MSRRIVAKSICPMPGLLAAAISLLAALGAGPAAAQRLNGAGATFPYPIYSKWFQAFSQAHPAITFNYQPVGSGAGISQYKAGTVDFAATDAPLTDAEVGSLPEPTVHVPTVAGSVVLAYNVRGVGPGLRLSGDVIADIFLGKITSWNDPRIARQNPRLRLPAEAITVAHRSDGSGTSYIFTNYLSAVSPEWKSRVGAGKSVNWPTGLGGPQNAGVAAIVQKSSGGIGYVELAYAIQNHLPYGPVRNRAGNYVLASIATTQRAAEAGAARMQRDVRELIVDGPGVNTYPIVGFTYLLIPRQSKDAAKGRALVEFLRWAMGPGQSLASTLLYAPLPRSVVAINARAIGTIH